MEAGYRSSLISRRSLLASTAALLVAGATAARARTLGGAVPWEPGTATPPHPVRPGPWMFFTSDEAALIEAAVDRLIPPDERGPGGKDAGCAVFIDRQLAGPYGRAAGLYMKPPFMPGAATQGYQKPDAPAARYRAGLKALADYVKATFAGKAFGATGACRSGQGAVGPGVRIDRAQGRQEPGIFHAAARGTRRKVFLPIRSMAATATWRGGNSLASPARVTTTATGSSATTKPIRCRRSASWAAPNGR